MKLVNNAKNCWRWLSVQAMVVAGAVQGAWMFIPEDLRVSMPPLVIQVITLSLLVAGVAGRLVDQTKRVNDED